MKIIFLTIGKTTDERIASLQEDYSRRIGRYCTFESVVIPELKNSKNLSCEEQKEREASLILDKITHNDDLILLDENGLEMSSTLFSNYISKKMMITAKRIVFVIGGPYGFSEKVYSRANDKISLSQMTFSHQMVRIFFVEQLYRAFTILKNEPYHHQ